jgi:Protein of unknown function (DUF2384)
MGAVKRKHKPKSDKTVKKPVKRRRDPDETVDIRVLILDVIPNAELWMDSPNRHFGAMKPSELIGTDKEIHLRNLVRAIKLGMFS